MIDRNIDDATVKGFGDEWERFDQAPLSPQERQRIFDSYFAVFPWNSLATDAVGFDLGCGSGRWATLVAPRVGRLHCIDPSSAIDIAKRNLVSCSNCEFHRTGVDAMPMADGSMDFGYSLGVLHHIPDTQSAMAACVRKLRPGAPFLVYLYYAFDNKPRWFRWIWKISEFARHRISRLPYSFRYFVSQIIALLVYYPLAKTTLLLEKIGLDVGNVPLSAYRHYTFYTMRTDALDRFGTRLEQRFTKKQIERMMEAIGLENIIFSADVPYWCAVGTRSAVTGVDDQCADL